MVESKKDDQQQEVMFGTAVQQGLLQGAKILSDAVKTTMGPSGKNVIIQRVTEKPLITKDGVTVAKSVNLKNPLERIGADLIKEVAAKTNEIAGDGTTTATVLAYEMLFQGLKAVNSGASPVLVKQGMDIATQFVVHHLKEYATKVTTKQEVANVGTISANGDESIGKLLSEALEKVGQDGVVTIEQAKSVATTLEIAEGMRIDCGFLSPFFVTNPEKQSCELENPIVFLTTRKICTVKELFPVLEAAQAAKRPLLVVADDVESEALHMLIVNNMKKIVQTCAIKAPSYGEHREELLSDIALVTGATVVSAASGELVDKNASDKFGKLCKKISVTKTNTTFVTPTTQDSINENVVGRISELRARLVDNTLSLDELQVDRLKTRIAKLSGGVAVIKVGGSTEVEMLERKDRVEDALNATQAAVKEGIVPGGGIALFVASKALSTYYRGRVLTEDEALGVEIIRKACMAPFKQIVTNTGKNFDVVLDKLEQHIQTLGLDAHITGYNAADHTFCNLLEEGVLDPVKVTRSALEYSNSVVGLMLTCECVVFDDMM